MVARLLRPPRRTFAALALVLACEAASDGPTDSGLGPCPDCTPPESNGPGGDAAGLCCSATRSAIDVTEPRATALGAEAHVARIEAGYEGPFQWWRSWGSSTVTGFDPATELQLSATVRGVEYVDREPLAESGNPLLCSTLPCDDYLAFDIHVELATSDGALAGGGDIEATTQRRPDTVESNGSLPIASFTGRLDLGVDTAPSRPGGLLTQLQVAPSGLAGSIQPWIDHIPQGGKRSKADEPLVGRWPVPSCPERELPIDVDAPLEEAPADTVRSLFAGVAAQLEGAPPAAASWLGGATAELAVELAGDLELACGDGRSYATVRVPLHLATSDGRLDLTLPATFALAGLNLDEGPSWIWSIRTEVMNRDAIEQLIPTFEAEQADLEAVVEAQGSPTSGLWKVAGRSGTSIAGQLLRW